MDELIERLKKPKLRPHPLFQFVHLGSHIVSKALGLSGEVYKMDEGGCFVHTRPLTNNAYIAGYGKGYWTWNSIAIRQPRLIRRYPRPFRTPRRNPSRICHCQTKTGGGKLRASLFYGKVYCKKCTFPVGTESFPNRIEKATQIYERASKKNPKAKPRVQVQRRKPGPVRRKGTHQVSTQNKKARNNHNRVRNVHRRVRHSIKKKVSRSKNKKVSKTRQTKAKG